MLVIEFLGGTAPEVGELASGTTKANRGSERRKAIRACFCELEVLVGLPTNKPAYNKVLDKGTYSSLSRGALLSDSRLLTVFAHVTGQPDEAPQDEGQPYGVFRLDKW